MTNIKRKAYPFKTMQVGSCFTLPVGWDMQHARVAASEYGRRHNQVYTCRMQEDRTMVVYRCELSQQEIDRRGRNAHRELPSNQMLTKLNANMPTEAQFVEWLDSFAVGQSYTLAASYAAVFPQMVAWVRSYSLYRGVIVATHPAPDGGLTISR